MVNEKPRTALAVRGFMLVMNNLQHGYSILSGSQKLRSNARLFFVIKICSSLLMRMKCEYMFEVQINFSKMKGSNLPKALFFLRIEAVRMLIRFSSYCVFLYLSRFVVVLKL